MGDGVWVVACWLLGAVGERARAGLRALGGLCAAGVASCMLQGAATPDHEHRRSAKEQQANETTPPGRKFAWW